MAEIQLFDNLESEGAIRILICLQYEIYKISSWNMLVTEYPNDFWHKRKIYNFDPYNVFLAIATNKPQRLKTVLCSRVTYLFRTALDCRGILAGSNGFKLKMTLISLLLKCDFSIHKTW